MAELLTCIKPLLKEENREEESLSATWVNEIDREGLWHFREGTYILFAAMEEVPEHFRVGAIEAVKEGRDYSCKQQRGSLTSLVTANN